MAGPILKLIIDKGPREGETIVSHSNSKIRIGRVVKGNTFAIRDHGISQKHLLIEFNGVNWTISDLDSSNGTFLNENQIEAMKAFNVSDGDTIKIGEETSILVKVEGKDENGHPNILESRPRRNPSRQATLKRGTLKKDQRQVSEQKMSNAVLSYCDKQEHEAPGLDAQLEAPADIGRGLRRRGAKRKAETTKDAVLFHQVEDHPEASSLLSDNYRAAKNVAPEVNAMLEAPANNARVTRQRRAATNATAKRNATLAGEVKEKEQMAVGPEAESTAHLSNCEVPDCRKNDAEAEAKRDAILACEVKEKGRLAVGSEAESTAHLIDCVILDHQVNDAAAGEVEIFSTSSSNANGGKECQCSGGETSDRIDLEKMTLGEWFDQMEKYLPKRINDIADEIITKLRKRQKQFDEYVSEHNRENQ
ncbi:hypothetical protein H6P81_020686 [Aristolochia fimbriata]|uniref:FHA domain-containing protein n=1 Tax=Aristolochia fimbriata TaxID=158543 RepID=A0AAV7DY37_ARIFI|nr:hypothetical protein H6P81_020686 [Aristolochia fimbriata]